MSLNSTLTEKATLSPYIDQDRADVNDIEHGDKEGLKQFDAEWNVRSRTSRWERFTNVQWVLINMLSTIAIVFLNKIVFSDPQLKKCQISIAIWHFFMTSVILYTSTRWPFRTFDAIRIPTLEVLPICIFFAGFLLLGNLSLSLNSVDFYQLAKVMTTPTVVALNFLLFGVSITLSTLGTVLVTCMGVCLVISLNFLSNPLGTLVAVAAFTVTALYQLWIGKKVKDLSVSPQQLLLNQAPTSVALLLVVAPFVDTIPNFATIDRSVIGTLFLSGVVAAMLNLSQFLVIGRMSALTFNVVSQVKTIVIISLSWYSSGRHLTPLEIIGVTMALGGAWRYAQVSKR